MKQTELNWVANARKMIGTKEIKGTAHNKQILHMLDSAFKATGQKTWIADDETPWCGTFVGYVMAESGLNKHIPKDFYRARAWESAGTKLDKPAYGCVVVFSRQGGGHVGIVVGRDNHGNIMVLGGNQGDMVCIKPFARSRVTAYRWCGTQPHPSPVRYDLPILTSDGKLSTNEA